MPDLPLTSRALAYHNRGVNLIAEHGKILAFMGRKKRKDPAAVKLGKAGAKARSLKLTKEERSELARNAARARWDKRKTKGA